MSDYFALPGVNWSSLKHMRDSPLKYKYRLQHPEQDKTAYALGRATHTLVFEPETFEHDYAIWTEGDRKGKAWKEYAEAHAAQTILKTDEADACKAMAEAVRTHPLVRQYLDGGLFETIIQWTDPETGLLCKAKPDWRLDDRRILLDLKTCRSIDGRRFGNEAGRFGYMSQFAHYGNGILHSQGWRPERTLAVAVEKNPPHDVGIFEFTFSDLQVGADEVADLLRRVKDCQDSGQWPGRYTTEQAVQLPAYIHGEVEFEYDE